MDSVPHEIQKIDALSGEAPSIPSLTKRLSTTSICGDNNPNTPVTRGTAQNGDVYFQAREGTNAFYMAVPEIVQHYMDKSLR